MAITKTKFINYIRCPRYVALDDLKINKLDSDVSFKEYQEEEQEAKIREILGSMFDEDGHDLLEVKDEQLEVMLPYYNEIEILSGTLAPKYFDGTFKFAYNTQDQESFDFQTNGIRYICYTDIYNETKDAFRIIEVKATTSKKYLSIGPKIDGEVRSIFTKGPDGIYYLLEDLNLPISDVMNEKKYYDYKQKLYRKLDAAGHYVYDLAVQRYIIENDLKQNKQADKIPKIKYYLAVLNCNYVFDGTYEKGVAKYDTDSNGEEIISYFDMTSVTKDLMDIIDMDRQKIEEYIHNMEASPCPIGEFCEHKKSTKCRYLELCWQFIPKHNSLLQYLDNHHGFVDNFGNKHERFELLNEGITSMLDLPKDYLNREKNRIQREVVETHLPYMNKDKIKDGIKQITYPIYHLDFETFPCPLPRYKGEVPYTQSVFQFSLHIERTPGVCDKEKDHFGFLAGDSVDHREELIQAMIKYIDTNSGGTILVYNDSFEKTRLKELANIFPEYKRELLKMRDMVFDLMNITKTKTSLYQELGYSKEEASLFNYYHEDMIGSFSIKKILPLFSNLTYKGMEIANGVQALVTYAKFPSMDKKEYDYKYQKLIEYCQQDTWAMVEILWGLKQAVSELQPN